jgi:hypothetical protein
MLTNPWGMDPEEFADQCGEIEDCVLENIPRLDKDFLNGLAAGADFPLARRTDHGDKHRVPFTLALSVVVRPIVKDTGESGWFTFELRTHAAQAVWAVQANDYTSMFVYWEYEDYYLHKKEEDFILTTTINVQRVGDADFLDWLLDGWSLARSDNFRLEVRGFEPE